VGQTNEEDNMTNNNRRRVIANIALTLDGRAAGPGGEYDMGFVLSHVLSDRSRAGVLRLTEATTAVMGRKNYEGFGGYWPMVARDENADPRDREFAQWLDRVEKVALSTTLTEPSWQNSRITADDPVQTIRELRTQPGGDIVVLSSQSIIRQLLEADEIDRLSINLLPELLGGGARLLEDGLPESSWTLAGAYPDDTGAIWLYYDRVREPQGGAGEFTLQRLLDASPDEAWRAWSDETLLRRWWGPTGFTCPRADIDLRVGGTTTVTMQAPPEFGGFQLHNQWRFTVVEKPVRIEFVSTFVDADGNTITPAAAGIPGTGVPDEVPHLVTFVAVGEGQTEIRITERGYTSAAAREQSKAGQAQVLDKMQAMFAAPSR
jgi:uncharacterized protein YndB with AHSA1/START domain/dihydrofolate reductase